MARKKRKQLEVSDEGPNLIPIMNLMTILIPFLLLSAVFVKVSILNSSLPQSGGPAQATEQQEKKPEDDKPKLNLTVTITQKGFTIAGSGAVLPNPADPKGPTIPKKDGEFDYEALNTKVTEIKKSFPSEKDCIIIPEQGTKDNPDAAIKYQTIINTMDALRVAKEDIADTDGDGKLDKLLFPGVIIGAGIL